MTRTSHITTQPAWPKLALLCCTALLALPLASTASHAQAPATKIAVFDFELQDSSAGGGIIPQDANDTTYLAQATDEAKRLLAASGRYVLVDTKNADMTPAKKFGIRNCNGCEAGIAGKLGADQAVTGVVNRINRTEFTLLIRLVDAKTGATVSNNFTGLRMGANYAWPRGVKWLMDNQLLVAKAGN